MVLTVTGALAERFDAQLAGGVAYYSSSIQVSDDASSYAGLVSLTKVDPILKLPGVAAALPAISVPARPGSLAGGPLSLPDSVVYSDPRERALSPLKTSLAAGRQLQPGKQGEVVLGAGFAAELGVRVGDSLDLPVKPRNANPDFVNHTFLVVGVLKATGSLPDVTASVGLLDAQLLLQESLPASFRDRIDPSSLATGITVYGKRGASLDQLADRINASVPGVTAVRPSDFVRGYDQGARFNVIALGVTVLALAFGAHFLVNAMQTSVTEGTPYVGLKMAFGARPGHIALERLIEATLPALTGGAIGVALGAGLALLLDLTGRSIGMDLFSVTGRLLAITLGLAIALGLGAGLVPALRAAQLDPAQALRAA
jgi:ABC-type lipoprotein release transport system permease subunit